MADSFPFFSRLLSPMESREFFERYWAKGYVRVPRNGPRSEWLTIEDLDVFFRSDQLPAAQCNVIAGGISVPIEDWSREKSSDRGRYRAVDSERLFQCYQKGATLILNQAQGSIPSLSRACRSLTRELGFRVWANIYITPPRSSGFARHQDDHEVLVLQILGAKLWTVYPDGEEPVELCLKPGDLLYLPRLTPHSARSADDRSIHVTFGVSPAYAFELVEELAAVAKQHPAFQQMVPLACFGGQAMETVEAEFAAKVAALFKEIGISGLLDRRFETLGKNQPQTWPGRFTDIIRMGDVSLKTIVRRRSGILFSVRDQELSVEVQFAGRNITIPAFLRECLEQITGETPFAIEEVSGLVSSEGKVGLIKSFVQAGFLEIVEIG